MIEVTNAKTKAFSVAAFKATPGSIKKITMYGPGVCPLCDRAKALFERTNIAFEKVNIDGEDDKAKALTEFFKEECGYKSSPVITVEVEVTEVEAVELKDNTIVFHYTGARPDFVRPIKLRLEDQDAVKKAA